MDHGRSGHTGRIFSLEVNPTSELVATGGADGVRLWDGRSGAPRGLLAKGLSLALAFSPDGQKLAVAGDGVRLWDLSTRRITGTLYHVAQVFSVSYGPDGRVASFARDGVARLWDGKTRTLLRSWRYPGSRARVLFSPDGAMLAVGAMGEGDIRIYSTRSGEELHRLADPNAFSLTFSADAKTLVVSGQDGLSSWDLASRSRRQIVARSAIGGPPVGVSLGPTGEEILLCSQDAASIWSARTGQRRLTFPPALAARYLPGGDRIVTVRGGGLRAWDARTGRALWRGDPLLGDARAFLAGDGWVALDSGARAVLPRSRWLAAVEQSQVARASEDGKLVCTLGDHGVLEVWDRQRDQVTYRTVPTLAPIYEVDALAHGCATVTASGHDLSSFDIRLYGPAGLVKSLRRSSLRSVSPNLGGAGLLVAGENLVERVDETGRTAATYPVRGTTASALITEGMLVRANEDGGVDAYALGSTAGAPIHSMAASAAGLMSLVSATTLRPGPAGALLGGFDDGSVVVWSLRTGVRLLDAKLFGAIWELRSSGSTVQAVSETGDQVTLDLSALTMPRCELMQRVWAAIPYAWREGQAVAEPPPRDHPCSRR